MALSLLIRLHRIPEPLAAIAKKYDVEVVVISEPFAWRGDGYTVHGQAPLKVDLDKYVSIFASEWNRYPIRVIKTAKLKRIVIGANFTLDGQVRAAVPAFEAFTMYFDTTLGNYNPPYQRSVIHHEFFHMIDNLQKKLRKDPEWGALNRPEFHYGRGGETVRNLGAGVLTHNLPGFLTPYAMSAIEEDKAELYSHLLVDPDYVRSLIKADPVIAAKVTLLKSRLKAWDSQFNEDFWSSKAD